MQLSDIENHKNYEGDPVIMLNPQLKPYWII